MMWFKIFVVLQVYLLVSQAEELAKYQSQTVAEIETKPNSQFKLCKCSGNKCEMDKAVAEEACKVLMERFRYYVYESGFMVTCEFLPKSCEGPKPKAHYIRAVYDSYYLRTSLFYSGKMAAGLAISKLFHRRGFFKHSAFKDDAVSFTVTEGTTGMPFEFDGVINIPPSDMGDYELCVNDKCRKTVNELCRVFIDSMKPVIPNEMKEFLGCTVRKIYLWEGKVRVAWSMMFHYHRLRVTKLLTTVKSLENMIEKIKTKVKPSGIIKEFRLTSVRPLDFCEIDVTAQTTLKYHPYMEDPVSIAYRVNTGPLYSNLHHQLISGDAKAKSCIDEVIQMNLTNSDGFVNAKATLWVSETCFLKRGLKSCEEVTKKIQEVWEQGSKELFSSWTPQYNYKLLHAGTPLEL